MYQKLSAFVFIFIFLLETAFAAAPESDLYPYEKALEHDKIEASTVLEAVFDKDLFLQVNQDYSNLRLINDRNESVDFHVIDQKAERVSIIEKISFSSHRSGQPTDLIDEDPNTIYSFDERVDGKNDSWVLVDFGKPLWLHQLRVVPALQAKIRSIELKAGNDPENLKKIKSKRNFTPDLDLRSGRLRYLKISLWGISTKLDELMFWRDRDAKIVFTAEPQRRYTLIYGGKTLDSKQYRTRNGLAPSPEKLAIWGKQTWNSDFEPDVDQDQVPNENDNCPFEANTNQKDADGDRIGDICDNAPEVKNFDQSDIDQDGLGDLIDNCKTAHNPEQKDKDEDGFGDDCDVLMDIKNENASNASSENKNESADNLLKTYNQSGIWGWVIGILAVFGLGIFLRKK